MYPGVETIKTAKGRCCVGHAQASQMQRLDQAGVDKGKFFKSKKISKRYFLGGNLGQRTLRFVAKKWMKRLIFAN